MLNRARSHAGFTIIELVIVVGIIGILATLVMPNYLRWRAKTVQTEVKTNLGGIFAAETAFFGEIGRYGSFQEVGFTLAAVTNRYTYRSPANGGAGGSSNTVGVDQFNTGAGSAAGGTVIAENTVIASAATLDPATFTATATGNIDADPSIDQWHVNDVKRELGTPDFDDVML